MTMAESNAAEIAAHSTCGAARLTRASRSWPVQELQVALGLETPPGRIECFDISTLQGTNTVGSMVVFAEGTPCKSDYRRFKFRGPVLRASRTISPRSRDAASPLPRAVEPEQEDPGAKARRSTAIWTVLPDLVIVDGGKGQLGVAVEVLKEFDLLDQVPVVGLAKQHEEIFRPGQRHSILIAADSEGLYLVQRIRDEAHRFGITYHRSFRGQASIASELDKVPGIGPKRRQALLKAFDLFDEIKAASLDELAVVPGMTRAAAQTIKECL